MVTILPFLQVRRCEDIVRSAQRAATELRELEMRTGEFNFRDSKSSANLFLTALCLFPVTHKRLMRRQRPVRQG